MALSTCVRCNQIFDKIRSPVCPKCEPDEEADFEKVREWIEANPDRTASEIAESTNVSRECVLRLLDDGRIASVSLQDIRCGRCGAPAISATKRLCEKCLQQLNQELAAEQARMRLASRKDIDAAKTSSLRSKLDEKRQD